MEEAFAPQRLQQWRWRLTVAKGLAATLLFGGLALFAPEATRENHESSTTLLRSVRFLEEDDMSCTEVCCAAEFPCASEGGEWIDAIPFALQIMMIIILICMSALFSGLTLGLMGLDKTGLEIVMQGDDARNVQAATKIYPVRQNGNLLLCTLLLGNVAVNSLLSILSAANFGGTAGFLASTFLIVIFGEIIPQALCARYALVIGSYTVPLVRIIMFILYPIAAPLAYCLDKALGDELATTYSSSEMKQLLQIHVREKVLDHDTANAMRGALQYKDIMVKEVMTPLEHTFMLSIDEKLNFDTIATIFKTGYSRIPVYEISKNNITGLLFVKDLIFIDPEDETPVRNFIQIFGRGVHVVWLDDKLGDVLRELKQGRSHMALVRDVNNEDKTQDPFYEIKGIITLEDIIEEILGHEIVDETDVFVDGSLSVKVDRENFDWARLRLLDAKIVDETLSHEEARAVTAHLRTNHGQAFKLLTDKQLERLVTETSVSELEAAVQQVGEEIPSDLLYKKGVNSDMCTLILSGKVTVLVGSDNFRTDMSAWSVLGTMALDDPLYAPDFTAFVSSGPCRCLRFSHDRFAEAVDASAVERRVNASGHSDSSVGEPKKQEPAPQSPSRAKEAIGDHSELGSSKHHGRARRTKLIEALQKKASKPDGSAPKDTSQDSLSNLTPIAGSKSAESNESGLDLPDISTTEQAGTEVAAESSKQPESEQDVPSESANK